MNNPNWNWKTLCNDELNATNIWDPTTTTFNPCFESLAIKCPIYILLALVSAYYTGFKRRKVKRTQPHLHIIHIRLLTTFLLLLNPIITLTLQLTLTNTAISLMSYVTLAISISSWSLHITYNLTLRTGITKHTRGPCIVIFSWFLTIIITGIDVINLIKRPLTTENPIQFLHFIICIVQVFYLATLVPKGVDEVDDFHRLLTVNVDEDGNDNFLDSYRQDVAPVWSDLGVAMHGASVLSKLTFAWVLPMMDKGAKGLLQTPDYLFELPHSLRTTFLHTKFWIMYKDFQLRRGSREAEVEVASSPDTSGPRVSRRNVSLLRVLMSCFGVEFFLLGIPKFLSDSFTFATPLLLNAIVTYKEKGGGSEMGYGYLYIAGMFGTTLFVAFLSSHFQFRVNNVGLKIRAVVIAAVYRKCLVTSSCEMMKLNTGEIVNYMSTDTDRIVNFCPSFHAFWSLPLQIAVCITLLYQQVGLACLTGIGFVVILIPVNKCLANKIGQLSTSMMEQKDQRVKLMNEILRGMSTIKFFAWEKIFLGRTAEYRNAELRSLKKRKYLDAACVYFWATTPVFITLFTLATYVWLHNSFTAAQVFTCLTLVNMLIMPLNAFPWVLNGLVEAWVSLRRIENLLKLPETNLDDYYTASKSQTTKIFISADFDWNSELSDSPAQNFYLHSINLSVSKGQLIGVVGTVGSGKTSLIQAILAEMTKRRGFVELNDINEGFGYVPQECWIQQGTIRSNILLGKRFDNCRYQRIIDACSLVEDLSIMPNGDETQVGDRGMTLSGGQKARICLARACYQNKNFYLLDDPLSAMDVHVARHIFQECIVKLLEDKTRILCTHQTKYLKNADWIIVMKDGTIFKQGSPEEILPFIQQQPHVLKPSCSDLISLEPQTDEIKPKIEAEYETKESQPLPENLITEEESETGTVKIQVYLAYLNSIGVILSLLIFLSMLLMQGTRNASDVWLAHWSAHSNESIGNTTIHTEGPLLLNWNWDVHQLMKFANEMPNISYYLKIYGIIVGCNTIFTLFRAFLFAYGGIQAATNVHNQLIKSLFDAPLSFFEKNPLGRILNRFSSDMYAIDDSLPFLLNIFLAQIFGLFGTLVITCYSLPWIFLLVIPLIAIYMNIQNYYRHTSRELKRQATVTLSPIYSHFSETLSGLTSIRAFRVESKFRKENEEYLERNQRVLFCNQVAGQWLNFCLQLIGVVLITGVTLLVIVTPVSISLAGLAISYGLTVTSYLNGVVTSFTETEKEMVNAERALDYIKGIGSEKWRGTIHAPPGWPSRGFIAFSHVYLRYREYLPYSLDNVTFKILPGEKIGIVGRTGAGKSSLLNVLFRLAEIQEGEILIDDVNIQYLDLNHLRSVIAIIPQDPFLFSGTVKQNLDPANQHSDEELLNALEKCHLSQVTQNMGGLTGDIVERARDLSQGQKQLFCLARALLTDSRILCIDEATASVDFDTDALIHQTITQIFRDRTVLTIAHRIETILYCDRILVMSNAQVEEFDSPKNLLANPNSTFYKLANKL